MKGVTAYLIPEHVDLIDELVRAGRYPSRARFEQAAALDALEREFGTIDRLPYLDEAEIAQSLGVSVAEWRAEMTRTTMQRLNLAHDGRNKELGNFMQRHSPPPEAKPRGVPDRRDQISAQTLDSAGGTAHQSGEYESPGPMPVARKVARGSAPPSRGRRGR